MQSKVLQAETLNKQMAEEKDKYAQLLEEERANTLQNETRVSVSFAFCLLLFAFFSLIHAAIIYLFLTDWEIREVKREATS